MEVKTNQRVIIGIILFPSKDEDISPILPVNSSIGNSKHSSSLKRRGSKHVKVKRYIHHAHDGLVRGTRHVRVNMNGFTVMPVLDTRNRVGPHKTASTC